VPAGYPDAAFRHYDRISGVTGFEPIPKQSDLPGEADTGVAAHGVHETLPPTIKKANCRKGGLSPQLSAHKIIFGKY
jgi:hypothetical protein